MIVGQIIALLGVYKAKHVHTISPYMIPIHITFYIIHMLQEHWEIYDKTTEVVKQYTNMRLLDPVVGEISKKIHKME